jgi:hypothetical protein
LSQVVPVGLGGGQAAMPGLLVRLSRVTAVAVFGGLERSVERVGVLGQPGGLVTATLNEVFASLLVWMFVMPKAGLSGRRCTDLTDTPS